MNRNSYPSVYFTSVSVKHLIKNNRNHFNSQGLLKGDQYYIRRGKLYKIAILHNILHRVIKVALVCHQKAWFGLSSLSSCVTLLCHKLLTFSSVK